MHEIRRTGRGANINQICGTATVQPGTDKIAETANGRRQRNQKKIIRNMFRLGIQLEFEAPRLERWNGGIMEEWDLKERALGLMYECALVKKSKEMISSCYPQHPSIPCWRRKLADQI